jgi:carbon monoxide dehydrogenase subunit G
MEFDNAFEVPLAPSDAWAVLMDIERVAPCMPGAELTEKVDDKTYKGKVGVKLGPVALSFAGTARFEEIDDVNHTARVKASGADAKGRGGANSTVTFRLEPVGSGSKVLVHTDLSLSGSVAQYGRGAGMIQEVSAQLIKQFATSLRKMIDAEGASAAAAALVVEAPAVPAQPGEPVAQAPAAEAPPAPKPAPPPPARPISGFSLMLRVLWSSIRRLFTSKA